MAYAVLRNNRRATKITLHTYEAARQYIRKTLRKMGREAYISEMYLRKQGSSSLDVYNHPEARAMAMWDDISRNPTNFTELGYSIRALQ